MMGTGPQRGNRGIGPPAIPSQPTVGASKQRWGIALRAIREEHGFTRTALIQSCWRVVINHSQSSLQEKVPTETQLSRIEAGKAKKVDRDQLELLFMALGCTPDERMHVLMLAGCTTIAVSDAEQPTEDAGLLNQMTELLYNIPTVRTALVDLMRYTSAASSVPISEGDKLEVLWSVLDLEVQRRKGDVSEDALLYQQALTYIGEIPGARERIVTVMRRQKLRETSPSPHEVWDALLSELAAVVSRTINTPRRQRHISAAPGD